MIYLKIDMAHAKRAALVDNARQKFSAALPRNLLSVNIKRDGSVAWVKLDKDYDLSAFQDVILDKEAGSNKRALADVYAGDWYPPEEI